MESRGQINVARRQLVSDKPESPNLRDFLRIRQDENFNQTNTGHANSSGRTLSSVLKTEGRNGEALRSHSNRTLLDIIRDDPNGGGNTRDGKTNWKYIKDKLRLRRLGSGNSWTSSVPVPASDVPLQPSSSNRLRMMTRRDTTRINMPIQEGSAQPDVDLTTGVPRSGSAMLQRNDSRAIGGTTARFQFEEEAHREGEEDEEESEAEAEGETPEEGEGGNEGGGGERMSLMALLAETDRQMGLDGSSYTMEEDDDDEEEEEEEKGGAGAGYNNCCVCMVRHKGAAFIPCGHTFCRLCSRELWVQRGNCPLCNNFILEILDIF